MVEDLKRKSLTASVPLSDAQMKSGNPPATYSANGTITIECVTCEAA